MEIIHEMNVKDLYRLRDGLRCIDHFRNFAVGFEEVPMEFLLRMASACNILPNGKVETLYGKWG